MYSLEVINQMNEEAGEEAVVDRKEPRVPTVDDVLDWQQDPRRLPIPLLGDHVPDGWEICDRETWFFVDSSGMGEAGEMALTVSQFLQDLAQMVAANPTFGYGIVEQGQFQLYIAPFRPKT